MIDRKRLLRRIERMGVKIPDLGRKAKLRPFSIRRFLDAPELTWTERMETKIIAALDQIAAERKQSLITRKFKSMPEQPKGEQS